MKDGIISAKQANEKLENSRKQRYEQLLIGMQEELDRALRCEEEYFRARIPAWCKKDMIVYLRKMGYEVLCCDGTEYYTIIFGESMLEELEEKERKKKLKRIAIVIFLAIVYWGYVTYGWIALVIGFLVGAFLRGHM